MKKLNYTQKMGLMAGSTALLAPAIGQAGIVYFDNTHAISIDYTGGNGTIVEWDVDGGGVNDFALRALTTTSTTSGYNYISLLSDDGRNGRGMVKTDSAVAQDIHVLNSGFAVGSALPSAYSWGNGGVERRVMLLTGTETGREHVGPNFQGGTLNRPHFIGFRFDIAAELHYGWAEVEVGGGEMRINRWAYNDIHATAINVGDTGVSAIPEPTSLALLAMGAAGIARMRRKQSLAA